MGDPKQSRPSPLPDHPAMPGRFWPMSDDGLILNDGAEEKIDPVFHQGIAQTINAYQRNLRTALHSVYVTGDVARGRAHKGLSDLQTAAVLKSGQGARADEAGWLIMAEGVTHAAQSAARRVDMKIYRHSAVFPVTDRFSAQAFDLATTGVCVWGHSVLHDLPSYPPCAAIANADLVGIGSILSDARDALTRNPSPVTTRELGRYLAEAIIHACGALVMLEEDVYTRDLDLSRDLFLLHYPERQTDLNRALSLACRSSDDPESILIFLDSVRAWMVPAVTRWLDKHNPERLNALAVPGAV